MAVKFVKSSDPVHAVRYNEYNVLTWMNTQKRQIKVRYQKVFQKKGKNPTKCSIAHGLEQAWAMLQVAQQVTVIFALTFSQPTTPWKLLLLPS